VTLSVLQTVGTSLETSITYLVNNFNPQTIMLGGVLTQASAALLPVIEQVTPAFALGVACEDLKFVASAHGAEACVMGAATLVLDDILREPAFS
jgi:predicted NBD/HSP70 family sugar kinase